MEPRTPSLVARWHDPDAWSTTRVAPHRQFDYWREFVADAHMRWHIPPIRCDRFPAFIRQGRCEGFRVTHLTAGKGDIVGKRGRSEIAKDDEALYNLIYIAEGSISLIMNDREAALRAGSFALWDTTRPMTFVTGSDLRQITFGVPQDRLRRTLPRVDDFVGKRIDADSGVSRLFADHVLALDARFGELPRGDACHVLDATTELLAAALSASLPRPDHDRASLMFLQRIMEDIMRRLDDPALDTKGVAARHQISERHLHRLFAREGTTPARWIRQQRLERCRRDLCSRRERCQSVTDIALRWGFRDSATFSKIFRRAYGISPRELLMDRPGRRS